jgi:hypothetical protein
MCEADLDEVSEARLVHLLNSHPEARDEYLTIISLNSQLEALAAGRVDGFSANRRSGLQCKTTFQLEP